MPCTSLPCSKMCTVMNVLRRCGSMNVTMFLIMNDPCLSWSVVHLRPPVDRRPRVLSNLVPNRARSSHVASIPIDGLLAPPCIPLSLRPPHLCIASPILFLRNRTTGTPSTNTANNWCIVLTCDQMGRKSGHTFAWSPIWSRRPIATCNNNFQNQDKNGGNLVRTFRPAWNNSTQGVHFGSRCIASCHCASSFFAGATKHNKDKPIHRGSTQDFHNRHGPKMLGRNRRLEMGHRLQDHRRNNTGPKTWSKVCQARQLVWYCWFWSYC